LNWGFLRRPGSVASAHEKAPERELRGSFIRLGEDRLKRALDLFEAEALDDVAGLDVLEAGEGHAALGA